MLGVGLLSCLLFTASNGKIRVEGGDLMRHSHEKALDIATKLMAAQLGGAHYGTADSEAEKLGKYFLKIVETIQPEIEKMPD